MSEQPTAAPTRPPPGAGGKKYAGLSKTQWYITGGVFVAVLGYLLWKRHQASAAAGSTAPTNQGSNECTDANGNPVDCNEQFAQELAALQNSVDQALGQQGGTGGGSAGGYGGGGTTGTGTGTVDGGATGMGTTTSVAPGTPTTSSGATTTKAAPKTAGTISGLAASNVTKTSFKASWKPAANATSYSWVVRNLASHTQTSAGTTKSTSVTVGGLKSGVDYNFGIQALPGGAGDNIHVRTS